MYWSEETDRSAQRTWLSTVNTSRSNRPVIAKYRHQQLWHIDSSWTPQSTMVGRRDIPEIHIEPSTSPSPTPNPIPAHVRPHSTRNSSYSSTASSRSRRPHAQQHEYVPVVDPGHVGLDERWQFEQAEEEAEAEAHEGSSYGGSETEEEEPAWDNMRDGSVSRRTAWRRPSPRWLYPFIVGATLSMGMTVAPKSELYINLACLSHPPQQPRSESDVRAFDYDVTHRLYAETPMWYQGSGVDDDMTVNTTIPSSADLPPYHPTPGDEWFKKIQREIYEYQLHHRSRANGTVPSTTARPVPTAYPSSPLPRPHQPSDGTPEPSPSRKPHGDGHKSPGDDQDPSTTDPGTRPPYHEIDPRMCKHDPKVQAATARMTMSSS